MDGRTVCKMDNIHVTATVASFRMRVERCADVTHARSLLALFAAWPDLLAGDGE